MSANSRCRNRLRKQWRILSDGANYAVPETIEDLRVLPLFPFVQLENLTGFETQQVRDAILSCTHTLQDEFGADRLSPQTVHDVLRQHLTEHFSGPTQMTARERIERLIDGISAEIADRAVVRPIAGLDLDKDVELAHGPWRIFRWSPDHTRYAVAQDCGPAEWHDQVRQLCDEHLLNAAAIAVEVNGDQESCRSASKQSARYVLDIMRFLVSIHLGDAGLSREIDLSLDAPIPHRHPNALAYNRGSQSFTLFTSPEPPRRRYRLSSELLRIFESEWNARFMWGLIERSHLTELEASIISAIGWFGEAQSDELWESAYIKYWASLEALLTGHKRQSISARLKGVIPSIVNLVLRDQVSSNRVARAYDLRSDVLHEGARADLSRERMNEVVMWAALAIAACTSAAIQGVKHRAAIEAWADLQRTRGSVGPAGPPNNSSAPPCNVRPR